MFKRRVMTDAEREEIADIERRAKERSNEALERMGWPGRALKTPAGEGGR